MTKIVNNELTTKSILIITSRSDIGGGPKHVLDLVTKLKEISSLKIYMAFPANGYHAKSFEILGHSFIHIPHRLFSPLHFFKMVILCKKNNIQIVHSHGRGAGIYSRILRLWGHSVVHTFHGIHNEQNIIGQIKITIDFFLKYLTNINICVSSSELVLAKKLNVAKDCNSYVIHNGIQHKRNSRKSTKMTNGITLGLLSRLHFQKGVDLIIPILCTLSPDKYKAILAGDGDERNSILKIIQEKDNNQIINYIGETTDASDFFSKIDIYISSSRWEGLPITVLEAMSNCVPVLLSDVPGNDEFKSYLPEQCFYKLNSEEDFKDKLSYIEKNMHVLSELGNEVVKKHFNLNQMAEKVLSVYEQISLAAISSK